MIQMPFIDTHVGMFFRQPSCEELHETWTPMMTRYAYAHVRYVGFESAVPNIRLKRHEILFAIGIQFHELYLRLRISAPPIQMICAIENQIHAVSQLLKIHLWHPVFYIFPSFFAPSCRNKSDAVLTMRW